MQKRKGFHPDSSVRSKKWRAKQGKATLTYLNPSNGCGAKSRSVTQKQAGLEIGS